MKFPAAQSILLIIAALVTILTWLIPAGSYNSLSYDSASDQFSIQSQDSSYTLPSKQASLEELNIKIPLEKFTSGAIYKPISIPNTYEQLPPSRKDSLIFYLPLLKELLKQQI